MEPSATNKLITHLKATENPRKDLERKLSIMIARLRDMQNELTEMVERVSRRDTPEWPEPWELFTPDPKATPWSEPAPPWEREPIDPLELDEWIEGSDNPYSNGYVQGGATQTTTVRETPPRNFPEDEADPTTSDT